MKVRLAIVMVLALAPAAFSQALVDRVPADAMVYVGWKGTDALGPAYEKSKLKKFIDGSAIPQLLNETLPQVMQKQSNDEPGKADDIKLASHFFKIIAKHPTAIFVAKFDVNPDDAPSPRMGLLCQAGEDKDTLLALFNKIVTDQKDADHPARVFNDGDLIALVVGYGANESPLSAANGAGGLGGTAGFGSGKSHLTSDPAIVAYVNVEQALSNVDAMVKAADDGQSYNAWTRGRDAAGIAGLKQVVYSSGFIGDEWTSQSFIEAPSPRTGLLKLLEPTPIDPALVGRIPGDATNATFGQFDLAGFVGTVRSIVTAVNPQAGKMMQQGMGFLSLSIGRRVDTEILAPLGSQWAMFTAPSLGGEGPRGLVLANKLKDPKLAKAAWGDLAFAISNTLPTMLARQGITITPTLDDKTVPGSVLFSVAIPNRPLTPCWVVTDQYLFIGVDPAVIAKAATVGEQARIETNGKFASMTKVLGSPAYSSFSFSDLAATAPQASAMFDGVWQKALNQAADNGVALPDKLLPSTEQMLPLLSPAMSASWQDDKGFYSVERTPFPLAAVAYGYAEIDQLTSATSAALGAALLLPATSKARESAARAQSMSNLRQIGVACRLHQNMNVGNYPDDLGALRVKEDLSLQMFVTARNASQISADIRAGTPEQQAAWINAHSDYVYVKPGKDAAPASEVPLVYEKAGLNRDGSSILYLDGHVEFVTTDAVAELIQKTTGAEPVKFEKSKKPTTQP